jgi:DNA primase
VTASSRGKALQAPAPEMKHRVEVLLPNNKSLVIEHEAVFEYGKVQAICESMRLPDGTQKESVLISRPPERAAPDRNLHEMVDAMHSVYQTQLHANTPAAQQAREYLTGVRGFSMEEIKDFQFGLSTGKEIFQGVKEEGWQERDLLLSGLASKRDDSRLKPVFANRVMIPIRDEEGQLVAFGGRSIAEDPERKVPKYMNSPESPLFSKKNTLYNLDKARDAIIKEGCAIVVEGYMDVLSLRRKGINNVVATLGTAFTEGHIDKLAELTPNITLCFDTDKAGISATKRACDLGKSRLGIHLLTLPAKDIDEFLREHSREDFSALHAKRISVPAEIHQEKSGENGIEMGW